MLVECAAEKVFEKLGGGEKSERLTDCLTQRECGPRPRISAWVSAQQQHFLCMYRVDQFPYPDTVTAIVLHKIN